MRINHRYVKPFGESQPADATTLRFAGQRAGKLAMRNVGAGFDPNRHPQRLRDPGVKNSTTASKRRCAAL
ncbi:hypothetical protein [Thioclava sp. DLFJ4-1]|uniref:hypothetical protein n=1 Tax=Thioclava sp. DLFJ4-1 TaxID=1915313 RepID=UPI0009964A0F|nr:hypothetical protein [Thioclava sp. DLFJ4-1]OOY14525.1 hypothetical protein BMI85_17855 [Thioclava sp. DLFJ4-1]